MAQRVKILAMPDSLILVPGTHKKVGRREMIQKVSSGPPYMYSGRHTYLLPNSKIFKCKHVSINLF